MPEAQDALDQIHAALQDWCQGDLIPGEAFPALIIFRRTQPLTDATTALAAEVTGDTEDALIAEQEFEAFVVTSQTCDVVEHPSTSPYVTVSPIVQLSDPQASEAQRGNMPRYPPVPGAGADAFADLAVSTTIEKSLLAVTTRAPGLHDDKERRHFQQITQRHYGRFAFPDGMRPALHKLQKRLRDKRHAATFEGAALALVDEIRMIPMPDWTAASIDVDVYFLLKSREEMNALEPDLDLWEALRIAWETRCSPSGEITKIRVNLVPLEELDAATYKASDPWDLGGMSPL
jgi:hypothetical protein